LAPSLHQFLNRVLSLVVLAAFAGALTVGLGFGINVGFLTGREGLLIIARSLNMNESEFVRRVLMDAIK
jgi:hypothetical protein